MILWRRGLARSAVVGFAVLSAACSSQPSPSASGPAAPTPTGTPTIATSSPRPTPSPTGASGAIALRQVASGLQGPLDVVDAGDAPGRLYVVEQRGVVKVVENGVVRAAPFLDLRDRVTSGGERGLLSIAFMPGYAAGGRFLVDYTDLDGDTVIERFSSTADGSAADPASAKVVLTIRQPASNHNGGLLLFGPDGKLWIGTGDGGGGAAENGQRTDTLLGKMLRIDVSGSDYATPPDNPFLNNPAYRPEIWATGLRNPWRYTFDRTTGDLWIGDVGSGRWEEVDLQPASSHGGENYGWPRMEGPDCGTGPCDPSAFVLPVTAYSHDGGNCVVVGGHVYRGTTYPTLSGTYLYGDYCSGRIWGLDAAAGAARTAQPTLLLDSGITLSSFGEDRNGELYVTDLSGGGLYQVVAGP
jgi:glucose/arabinose dehydrogenase